MAAKGREEEGGRVVTTHQETEDSARARESDMRGARGEGTLEGKQGMFVVRVIWPIKPRGGAQFTPASPFADR